MVSMDGVMQAPGGPEEDPTGGFKFGGWVVWLYRDTGQQERVAALAQSIFWLVLPSLVLFTALPLLLRGGWGFWASLALSCAATAAAIWRWFGCWAKLESLYSAFAPNLTVNGPPVHPSILDERRRGAGYLQRQGGSVEPKILQWAGAVE